MNEDNIHSTKHVVAYLKFPELETEPDNPEILQKLNGIYSVVVNTLNHRRGYGNTPFGSQPYGEETLAILVFSNNFIIAEELYGDKSTQVEIINRVLDIVSIIQTAAKEKYQWSLWGYIGYSQFYISEKNKRDEFGFVWGDILPIVAGMEKTPEKYPGVSIDPEIYSFLDNEDLGLGVKARYVNLDTEGSICLKSDVDISINEIEGELPELEMGKYIVAYLDMLGTVERMTNDSGDKSLNAIYNLYLETFSHQKAFEDTRNKIPAAYRNPVMKAFMKDLVGDPEIDAPKIKILSDNIVFAVKASTDEEDNMQCLQRIYTFVSHFQTIALLNYRWLLRGGVTIGDLYIDDVFAWGPAIVRSIYLEENTAKNPRVIVDDPVSEVHSKFIKNFIADHLPILKHIHQDDDDAYFVSYQDIITDGAQCYSGEIQTITQRYQQALITLLREYRDNPSVRKKVEWAIKYHNQISKERGCKISISAELIENIMGDIR